MTLNVSFEREAQSPDEEECFISEQVHLNAMELHGGVRTASRRPSLSFLHQFDEVVPNIDIPHFLNEHQTTLRFPEIVSVLAIVATSIQASKKLSRSTFGGTQLLCLLVQAEREAIKRGSDAQEACIGWTLDGRALIIRNKEELVSKLLTIAFCKKAKFTSFTRKLYRWGFRQPAGNKMNAGTGTKVFWHPCFQRDNKPLMLNMKSTTAEGTMNALKKTKKINKTASLKLLADAVTLPVKNPRIAKPAQPLQSFSFSNQLLSIVRQRHKASVAATLAQRLRLEQPLSAPTMFSRNILDGGPVLAFQHVHPFMSRADLVTTALYSICRLYPNGACLPRHLLVTRTPSCSPTGAPCSPALKR
jgi:hypothetical protein